MLLADDRADRDGLESPTITQDLDDLAGKLDVAIGELSRSRHMLQIIRDHDDGPLPEELAQLFQGRLEDLGFMLLELASRQRSGRSSVGQA